LITVHVTGPIEKAKQTMKPDQSEQGDDAGATWRRGRAFSRLADEPKGDADHCQADRHADQPGEQELPPSQTVDEGDGDQRGEDVDAADRPGGHRRLRRLCDKAGGAKDLVGVVDDRVDAGDLLEDGEPDSDQQRTPPLVMKHLAPGGAAALPAQRRLDGVEACLEVDAGRILRSSAAASARRFIFISHRGDFGAISATPNNNSPGTADAPRMNRQASPFDSQPSTR
jgi:hypothetical protein